MAFSFLAVSAFSTAPSALYGLYAHRDHLSSLTITIVYAVYAGGIVVALLLAGHISDWYGRRAVLLPALGVAVLAAVVFLVWRSLPGLLIARVLTGFALGIAVATATAFITDLDAGPGGVATNRAGMVATIANVGGLGLGALIAGLLARYEPHALTLPFIVLLAGLLAAVVLVALAPEGHPAVDPRPRYRPQRLAAPAGGRQRFIAAITGAFAAFAVGGVRRADRDIPDRARASLLARTDRVDDLPELRRRRCGTDDHHELAGPSPACCRNPADHPGSGASRRLGLDNTAEPRCVSDQQCDSRRRHRRDHPRLRDDRYLDRQPWR